MSAEVETFIVFHENLRKKLKTVRQQQPNNLPVEEQSSLQVLQQRTDLVIPPADKGSAVVIIYTSTYRKEALHQLGNVKFYERLKQDPTSRNNETIVHVVNSLRTKGSIDVETARDLVETKGRTPHFYTLPKAH